MTTMTKPDVSEMVAQSKKAAESGKARLLKVFEFVPDDKLTWSPSPHARTPIQIVAHCGVANGAFATILRGEKLRLPKDPVEAAALIRKGGSDVTSREVAIQIVESSTAEVLAALDNVSEELAATSPDSPFGPIPFPFWMGVPGDHMEGHAHQIEYIQTIWGDIQDHN